MRKDSFGTFTQRLLALAIILMPFSDLMYFENLIGEMAREGAFYPILIAMVLWSLMLVRGMKVKVPKNLSVKLLLLFLSWLVISSVANLPWIAFLQTKGRTGVEKLVLQLVLISFVTLSALLVFNIVSRMRQPLLKFRYYVLLSFIVAGLYSFVEIIYLTGNSWGEVILQTLDLFIRSNGDASSMLYGGRLRSVSNEPSWFAMYCSFIFPWIFSYVFTKRKHIWLYLILSIYFVLLVVLTQSRTAYFITTLQFSLFLLGMAFTKFSSTNNIQLFLYRKRRLALFAIGVAFAICFMGIFLSKDIRANSSILAVFSSLSGTSKYYQLSNLTRFGSQATALIMAIAHPIFGVGLGQYGFYMPDYVPEWAALSVEIQNMVNPSEGTVWPSVYNVYIRIAAELGLVGLAIWLIMWIVVLKACYKRYQLNRLPSGQPDVLGLSLMISIIGVLLSGLNTDSLRFFGFWINLGLAWFYLKKSEIMATNSNLKPLVYVLDSKY